MSQETELPEPDINGTAYDATLKICYTSEVNYSPAKLIAYGAKCAAAARAKALEEAMSVVKQSAGAEHALLILEDIAGKTKDKE